MALTYRALWGKTQFNYRCAQLFAGVLLLSACGTSSQAVHDQEALVPVTIVGVQHMGKYASVAEFYINGYQGGSTGRLGGGGSSVCCISLPKKWRPHLTVEVRWKVIDWTNEVRTETAKQNYRSLSFDGPYVARVPVERYDEASSLYIHFFPDGRIRVVSSSYSVTHPSHPVHFGEARESESATAGTRIKKGL